MFTEFLLRARFCARVSHPLSLLILKTFLKVGTTFPTGKMEMEQLRLSEVKGTAPGCPASPWYSDNQDLPGSRAPVASKAF